MAFVPQCEKPLHRRDGEWMVHTCIIVRNKISDFLYTLF